MYTRTIVKEIWEIVYNIEDQTQRAYIISDEDYEGIVSEAGYDQMKYFISVSSPDSLPTVYERLCEISPVITAKAANLETQAKNKLVVSVLILLAVMLLLFSLVSLILLRINQDISEEKRKYSNLFSIGYTYAQLQGEIRKEMATLFFVPPCIRFVYFYYVCTACEQQNQPSASHSDFWSDVAIRCSPIWLLPGGNKDIGQTIFKLGEDRILWIFQKNY